MLGYPEGVTDDNLRGQLQEFVGLRQRVDQLAEDLCQATGFEFYAWRDGRYIAQRSPDIPVCQHKDNGNER